MHDGLKRLDGWWKSGAINIELALEPGITKGVS